ncbi:ABC transporter ATP-binding protein [Pantoea anthophila]|uniref:ABC transporter ATP-binding protein n=1 Tax=Pantoea anthophila TaxID=470931 RepID=UPI00277D795C|nr:ABC transporter ATP-binding protein [Pantoea anthophila]MDQ1214272.1 ABC-type polysaccharide/polyol phosphate transport system ATPase subunit [Pantoea anthophila]
MIRFENVTKTYKSGGKRKDSIRDVFSFKRSSYMHDKAEEFIALKDISFNIEQGQSYGIMGRNGAGKSTLLKLMTRIILPTSGVITLKGTFSSLLEVGAGFHQDLSGWENIFLSGAILGMSRQEVKSKIDEIIDFSEVGEFIDQPVKYYSSGMYLRLAFSIGVHLKSDVLVIDEAISVGDASFQNKCIKKINEIKKQGKTIAFVSHDADQVLAICEKAIVLEHGQLVFDGATQEAIEFYNRHSKS